MCVVPLVQYIPFPSITSLTFIFVSTVPNYNIFVAETSTNFTSGQHPGTFAILPSIISKLTRTVGVNSPDRGILEKPQIQHIQI